MTDKKTEELNEAELDQVTGGGHTVARYHLENAWPAEANNSKIIKATSGGGSPKGASKIINGEAGKGEI